MNKSQKDIFRITRYGGKIGGQRHKEHKVSREREARRIRQLAGRERKVKAKTKENVNSKTECK